MVRTYQTTSDRLLAGLATIIVIALLGAALLFGLRVGVSASLQKSLAVINVMTPPPPQPHPKIHRTITRKQATKASPPHGGGARATDLVVPPPSVVTPPLVVAKVPDIGNSAAMGAGSGRGSGDGSGDSDGSGDGDGDGGTPPRFIKGRLSISDLPPDLREAGRGGKVGVRYTVGVDGRVSACSTPGSSGSAELDALTCRLIEERFRFRPSLDGDGRPVESIVVETHEWIFDQAVPNTPKP